MVKTTPIGADPTAALVRLNDGVGIEIEKVLVALPSTLKTAAAAGFEAVEAEGKIMPVGLLVERTPAVLTVIVPPPGEAKVPKLRSVVLVIEIGTMTVAKAAPIAVAAFAFTQNIPVMVRVAAVMIFFMIFPVRM